MILADLTFKAKQPALPLYKFVIEVCTKEFEDLLEDMICKWDFLDAKLELLICLLWSPLFTFNIWPITADLTQIYVILLASIRSTSIYLYYIFICKKNLFSGELLLVI